MIKNESPYFPTFWPLNLPNKEHRVLGVSLQRRFMNTQANAMYVDVNLLFHPFPFISKIK